MKNLNEMNREELKQYMRELLDLMDINENKPRKAYHERFMQALNEFRRVQEEYKKRAA